MLSAAEIASMRDQHEAALPLTMTVQRATMAADGMGGRTNTPVLVLSEPCRLTPRTGREEGVDDVDAIGDFILTYRFDLSIAPLDRVTIGSETYEVLHVYDVHSWQMAGRAEVRLFE